MRHVSTIAEPQRSTCLEPTKKEVKTITNPDKITTQLSHFHGRTASYWMFLETEDGAWSVNIHDNYNEDGIKWTMISANVMVWGIITDI